MRSALALAVAVAAQGVDECIPWQGAMDRYGYGKTAGGRVTAHRAVYEAVSGVVPAGLVLDHICRVRDCVNVRHLRPLTNAQNLAVQGRALQTHCVNGHEYTLENTYRKPNGCRDCRACQRDRSRTRKKAVA